MNSRDIIFKFETLKPWLLDLGFEFHPFQVGWYNSVVETPFKLQYEDRTLCLLLISTPSMFEKSFIPFVKQHGWSSLKDPLDSSIEEVCEQLTKKVELDPVVLHDYDMDPVTRRPKILIQTAGHVSGAAYIYQPGPSRRKGPLRLCPVSLHPNYGGWFAFRAVMIFPEAQVDLKQTEPVNPLPNRADQDKLLELFNYHWKDNRFRDVIATCERYSEIQQEYFITPPKERKAIVDKIIHF